MEPEGESGTENEDRRETDREGEPRREAEPMYADAEMKGREGVPALEAETEADLDILRVRSFEAGGATLQPKTDARMAASESSCRASPSTSMASSSLSLNRDKVFFSEESWWGVSGWRMPMSLTRGSSVVALSFRSLTMAVGVLRGTQYIEARECEVGIRRWRDGRLRSHWRVFQGQPVLWLATKPCRCFSMRALAKTRNG